MRRTAIALGIASVLGVSVAAATDRATGWAGAYEEQFENGLVTGETYQSTNSVRIVRIDDSSALVEINLEFYNGHSCTFGDVFNVEDQRLVYRETEPTADRAQCVLSITRDSDAIVLHDDARSCAQYSCGARGGYDGITLPAASQRPLTREERAQVSEDIRRLRD